MLERSPTSRPGPRVSATAPRGRRSTVTAGAPGEPLADFDSGLLGTGDSYELTFDDPGEYALFCVLHPAMTATVTVE